MFEKLPTGKHRLSGIEQYSRKTTFGDNIDGYYVIINNNVYAFELDPDDGYRSYGSVFVPIGITPKDIKNRFVPHDVIITLIKDHVGDGGKQFYQIVDAITGKIVLEIGTDYYDSYYPCAIFHYYPENLAINNKEIANYTNSENKTINKAKENINYVYNNTWIINNTGEPIEYTITPPNVEYNVK